MSDELETVKESAKAAQELGKAGQEIAKTTRVAIEAGSDLARWGAKVLGTVPEDLCGLTFGDFFHELRIRNMGRISKKTDEKLEQLGVKEPKPIDAKVAIRAFAAASEESDETLQDLWTRLFANAMDPNQDVTLQGVFIDTLKQFEPIDALVFEQIPNITTTSDQGIGLIADRLNLRWTLVAVSASRLERLGCVDLTAGAAQTKRAGYRKNGLGTELLHAIKGDVGD